MLSTELLIDELGNLHHAGEGGRSPGEERERFTEATAVGERVPGFREAAHRLHGDAIDEPRLQHFIRRMRAVEHAPFHIVPNDGRAAQPL